jgi:hypothetical protein
MPEIPEIPEELPLADEAAVIAEGTPLVGDNDEAGRSAEIRTTEDETKEETPVIDVHAPHGGLHTWKDFWIHLGTITLGLLIAISLEQSVEWVHRLHQRHELDASLRAECAVNKERAEDNFIRYDEEMTWLLGLHRDIARLQATGGKLDLPYRKMHFRPLVLDGTPYTATSSMALLTAVFDNASADGRLALLPDDVARSYSRLYRLQEARFNELRYRAGDAVAKQEAFEGLFADSRTPTTPVLARMSQADLKQYDALVIESFTALRGAKGLLTTVYGTNNAMRQGLYDAASLHRLDDEAKARFADDWEAITKELDAEDAARDEAGAKTAGAGGK